MRRFSTFVSALTLAVTAAALVTGCGEPEGAAPQATPEEGPILEASTTAAVVAGEDDPTVVDAVTTPAIGARHPLVVVTLFEDYECPYCVRTISTADRIVETWPEVQVQFRQFPLYQDPTPRRPTGFHLRSKLAAQAALAAHLQGRFLDFHKLLFREREAWRLEPDVRAIENQAANDAAFKAMLVEWATELGMDGEQFLRDMSSSQVAQKIESDRRKGEAIGIRGTPGFAINSHIHQNKQGFGGMARIIRKEIAEARALERELLAELGPNAPAGAAERIRATIAAARTTQIPGGGAYAKLIIYDDSF